MVCGGTNYPGKHLSHRVCVCFCMHGGGGNLELRNLALRYVAIKHELAYYIATASSYRTTDFSSTIYHRGLLRFIMHLQYSRFVLILVVVCLLNASNNSARPLDLSRVSRGVKNFRKDEKSGKFSSKESKEKKG